MMDIPHFSYSYPSGFAEFPLQQLVDIIDNRANGRVGENTVESGDEIRLVKVRI